MICRDMVQQLQPYADGELDLVRHVEIEKHLAGCCACAEQLKHLQSLRAAVSSPSLYHRAPTALRDRIQLATPAAARERSLSIKTWMTLAAAMLFMIGATATVGVSWSRIATSSDDRLAEQVVLGHIRSLQVSHLMDVASSDRHTVKPWFHGKLDFSPQVPDLTPEGYTLSGGRLDYLTDRPVAALVYYRRLHAINVFTWPAADDGEKTIRPLARQGFHLRHWQRGGMTYWAISDLNDQELDDFVRLFQEHSKEMAQ